MVQENILENIKNTATCLNGKNNHNIFRVTLVKVHLEEKNSGCFYSSLM